MFERGAARECSRRVNAIWFTRAAVAQGRKNRSFNTWSAGNLEFRYPQAFAVALATTRIVARGLLAGGSTGGMQEDPVGKRHLALGRQSGALVRESVQLPSSAFPVMSALYRALRCTMGMVRPGAQGPWVAPTLKVRRRW